MPLVDSTCKLSGVTERIERVLVAFASEGYPVIHPRAVTRIFPKDKLKLVRNIFRNKVRLGYLALVDQDTYRINNPHIVTRLPRALLANCVFLALRKAKDRYLTCIQVVAGAREILGRKVSRGSVAAVLCVWHKHGAVISQGKTRLDQAYKLAPEVRRRPTLVR